MAVRPTLDISFPALPGIVLGPGALERVQDGILVKTIGGLRLSMIQDAPLQDIFGEVLGDGFRVQVINNVPLGKDEKVYISRAVTFDVLDTSDPNFTHVRDSSMVDVVIDVDSALGHPRNASNVSQRERSSREEHNSHASHGSVTLQNKADDAQASATNIRTVLSSLMSHVSSLLGDDPYQLTSARSRSKPSPTKRLILPAALPTGAGAAPMPDVEDASTITFLKDSSVSRLPWSSIYFSDETCEHRIPLEIVQSHQVIVLKRGGCSFSQKLKNIAAHPPSSRSALKLVIIVSYDETELARSAERRGGGDSVLSALAAVRAEPFLARPLLDEIQVTAGGIPRPNLIPMVLVGGGEETYELLKRAGGVGIKRRYSVRSQGIPIKNLYIV